MDTGAGLHEQGGEPGAPAAAVESRRAMLKKLGWTVPVLIALPLAARSAHAHGAASLEPCLSSDGASCSVSDDDW
jgi:hypothetical protein